LLIVYTSCVGHRPESVEEEDSSRKDETQPDVMADLEKVVKTAEQPAPQPETDISSSTHDEL